MIPETQAGTLAEVPFSLEAEMSVLGGMLIDADAVVKAAERLREGDFHREAHRRLFRAMLDLHEVGAPIEPVTLSEQLKTAGDFEAVGGAAYLAELWDYVPTAANLEYHAKIVREKAELREEAQLRQEEAKLASAFAENPANDVARVLLQQALLGGGSRTRPSRFRTLSDSEIEDLPLPDQLIDGMLVSGSLAVLYGPPGGGKSFLALAWALSVAGGVPWNTRAVKSGPVLYVAAEGSAGIGLRVRAWKAANLVTGSVGVHFLPVPVSMSDPAEVGKFIVDAIRPLPAPPALIIVDTLARCLIGGDENSTKDMSAFIAGVDRLREETGAAVLVIHHSNKSGDQERGNTALRGAADTMMLLKTEDDRALLTCEKQKDMPAFERVALRLVPVLESCVLVGADFAPHQTSDALTSKQLEALDLFRTHFPSDGVTATDWLDVSGFPKRTFFDARKALVARGYVQEPQQTRGGRYTLTAKGEEFLSAKVRNGANEGAAHQGAKVRAEGSPSLEGTLPPAPTHPPLLFEMHPAGLLMESEAE